MDKHLKLKCVQGLIIGLDEQIYRLDQMKVKAEVYNEVLDKFYNAIKEQLGFPNEKEKIIKELHEQGLISAEDKLKLLNVKTVGEGLESEPNFTIIVNGNKQRFFNTVISYERVVELAKGFKEPSSLSFTVTYSKGVHEAIGTLTLNETVDVCSGMCFNAVKTNKA